MVCEVEKWLSINTYWVIGDGSKWLEYSPDVAGVVRWSGLEQAQKFPRREAAAKLLEANPAVMFNCGVFEVQTTVRLLV